MAKKALPKYIRVKGHVYKLRTADMAAAELKQRIPNLIKSLEALMASPTKDTARELQAVIEPLFVDVLEGIKAVQTGEAGFAKPAAGR